MKRHNNRGHGHKWTAERRARYNAKIAARNRRPVSPCPEDDPEVAHMQQALTLIRGLSDPARDYVLARIGEGVD